MTTPTERHRRFDSSLNELLSKYASAWSALATLRGAADACDDATALCSDIRAEICDFTAQALADLEAEVRAELETGSKLLSLCKQFITDQRISGAETVHQCDRVIENAYGFIEQVCDVVGYEPGEEDE